MYNESNPLENTNNEIQDAEWFREELKRGEAARTAMIDHLIAMDCERIETCITRESGCYQIKVIRTM